MSTTQVSALLIQGSVFDATRRHRQAIQDVVQKESLRERAERLEQENDQLARAYGELLAQNFRLSRRNVGLGRDNTSLKLLLERAQQENEHLNDSLAVLRKAQEAVLDKSYHLWSCLAEISTHLVRPSLLNIFRLAWLDGNVGRAWQLFWTRWLCPIRSYRRTMRNRVYVLIAQNYK